ncbi:MAG: DNA cytosine methyltransferase [Ardenticatenaceae bacterium]|nr:DNA cytosine methyltransferase [Ardenticatenaceae bacterium]
MKAVSLFSNCGAGDLGYRQAGFRFEIMAELIPHRLDVALLNHPGAHGVKGDLRETWQALVDYYNEATNAEELSFLAACPPCQGMSSNNSDRGNEDDPDAGSRDERNLLVGVIVNVAQSLSPKIIVVENVPAFLTRKVRHPMTQLPVSAASWLLSALETDYAVFPILVNLKHYGVPQNRKRTFLTFIRRDVPGLTWLNENNLTPYPIPTHDLGYGGKKPIGLKAALQSFGLPILDARSKVSARTTEEFANSNLHFVPVWTGLKYSMVAAIPPNSGKSAWDNDVCLNCGAVTLDPDAVVCSQCDQLLPKPIVEEVDETYRLIKGYRSSSYRRMSPDEPAATITTASGHVGSSRTIHFSENRLFSALECALLQTFPEDFNWGDSLETVGHTNVRAMIGEAVPPLFTRLHGEVLVGLLNGERSEALLPQEDERFKKATKRLQHEH